MNFKALIVRFVVSLALTPIVFCEPDLCRNPKLDSISFITSQDLWFFTSGGYYWYIKEKDFPPGPPTDKLPDGFTRGDAAFYSDFLNVCKGLPNARQEQVVMVVEKGEDGNKIIEYDTRSKNWSTSHSWNDDRMIGRAKINQNREEIEAIFSIRDSEVFAVQKDKYAGINWKPEACKPGGYAKEYEAQNIGALQNSKDHFDAITVKNDVMYYFIGSSFWVATINYALSKEGGKISVNKGAEQNTSSQFFKFKKCSELVDPKPTNGAKPDPEKDPENVGSDKENDKKKPDSGFSGVFLIIIMVFVVVVVVLVIGSVVFFMGKMSAPDLEKNKDVTTKGAAKKPVAKKGKPAKSVAPKTSQLKPSKK